MNQVSKDDLKDVIDFLANTLPFSALSDESQYDLARKLEVTYLPQRSNSSVPIDECLYLVRTGAFEIVDQDNRLVDKLGEGECFGISSLLHGNPKQLQVRAIEDSLVYCLSKADFNNLLDNHKSLHTFFTKLVSYRSNRHLEPTVPAKLDMQYTRRVESLIQNKLVWCSAQSSIREAAEIMRENKVSCLILLDRDKQLQGIVTDRDLRNRVVADALDVNLPITRIATLEPVTLPVGSAILEAQLLMSNVGIHHLPIMAEGKPIAVITASDIIRAHSVSMIHLVDRIFREQDAEAVAQQQREVKNLIDYWIQADVSPLEIGDSFAVIGDAFVRKAIHMAQKELGEAPMPFAWLAFGSQARKEQSFASDQDNGLILAYEPNEIEADYFARFSVRVCQLLDRFGYDLCPGDIMASNPKWRLTLPQWQQSFERWLLKPEPEALLNASIFFDMRVIYGPDAWLDGLKDALVPQLKKTELFFMHLTRNALRAKPPLGFFRSFIVNNSGDHENELDIKHQGIALINDIARILALSEGRMVASTAERLSMAGNQLLQKPIRDSLLEAWLLLNELKLEHQLEQLKQGTSSSNYINPDQLSPLRRAHLKNAFKSIERAQKALSQHYLRGGGV